MFLCSFIICEDVLIRGVSVTQDCCRLENCTSSYSEVGSNDYITHTLCQTCCKLEPKLMKQLFCCCYCSIVWPQLVMKFFICCTVSVFP